MASNSREALAPTLAATPTPGSYPGLPIESLDVALPEGEIVGTRYRIVAVVGRGGQGDVYQAEDLEVPGHVVALKLMHREARTEEEREFAMRELRMLASVSHPTIVQFKDSGWYGNRLFFVMPWLRGRTLEAAGKISRAEARRIFENIAAAIAALHANGMRHQDIKPSNVFLARIDGFDAPMPMLIDLGVAAHGDDAPLAGSPDYFAPEVAAAWPAGDTHVGPSADVYALALTLRNALEPETAENVDAFSKVSLKLRATEPVKPPRARELRYLRPSFARWLAIDPERRPTAAELLDELAILTAPEDRRAERLRVWRRIVPLILILAVVGAGVGYWVRERLRAQAKAAAVAVYEQQEAEEAEAQAHREAERARESARAALNRARSSEEEAEVRGAQAASALAKVRTAQRQLGRATGDRERLEQALEELQVAFNAAEQARVAEARARLSEREQAEEQRRALEHERDRSVVAANEAEARVRTAEARVVEMEARLSDAERRLREAEARASERVRGVDPARRSADPTVGAPPGTTATPAAELLPP